MDECVCVCSLCRCGIDDTAQYTAVAVNSHGQASSQAAVIVKSEYLLKQAVRIIYSHTVGLHNLPVLQDLVMLRIDVQLQNSIQN